MYRTEVPDYHGPMPNRNVLEIDVHVDEGGALAEMGREILAGLDRRPRRIPSKYFYDERGSLLFERITELPEYYLTRAEERLLDRRAGEIAGHAHPRDLVELGPGSAKKTRRLIEAALEAGALERYVPLEVSREMAERAARNLVRRYPGLQVHAVVGDFENHLAEIPDGGPRLVAFLGSTIGNFPEGEAVALLRELGTLLQPGPAGGGMLLLGTDLVKDRATLEAAYNDSRGITELFNKNILRVLNQRLDANFDSDGFDHVSRYNKERSRIETFLESRRKQTVFLREIQREVTFEKGELLATEVSCKYTHESVAALLEAAGLALRQWYTDDENSFALSLAAPRAD